MNPRFHIASSLETETRPLGHRRILAAASGQLLELAAVADLDAGGRRERDQPVVNVWDRLSIVRPR
jgi:hypothetical protein